jgi:hypothetical protein
VVSGNNIYNCSTFIKLPNPRGKGNNSRNPDYSFIRLSLPYVESDVRFEISFHSNNTTVSNSALNMQATQYLVSVNGKTGERVRRTETYIGGMSNDAIIPLWSASVSGEDDTSGVSKCKAVGSGSVACELDNTKTAKTINYTTENNATEVEYKCTFNYVYKNDYGVEVSRPDNAQLKARCIEDAKKEAGL